MKLYNKKKDTIYIYIYIYYMLQSLKITTYFNHLNKHINNVRENINKYKCNNVFIMYKIF